MKHQSLGLSGLVIMMLAACQATVTAPPQVQSSPRSGATASPGVPGATVAPPSTGATQSPVTSPVGTPATGYVALTSSFVMPSLPLTSSQNGASLSLPRVRFKPGNKLQLSFTTPSGLPFNAWIGIMPHELEHGPQSVRKTNDIEAKSLDGKTSGSLEFITPALEKQLDFRMYDNAENGRELAVLSFVVTRELPSEETQTALLSLPKSQFKPGKIVRLGFKVPASFEPSAWVALVPSFVSHGDPLVNEQRKLSSKSFDGKLSGEIDYQLTNEEGQYDFRLHDRSDQGREAGYFSIRVSRDLPPEEIAATVLSLDKTSFRPGERLRGSFKAPASFDPDAWFGIVPENIPHGEEDANQQGRLSFETVNGRLEGNFEFNAPDRPGSYSVRIHDRDAKGKEVKAVNFTVAL